MEREFPGSGPDERRAVLGLWAIAGVGPRTLAELRARVGPLPALLELPVQDWVDALPRVPREWVLRRARRAPTLAALAERVRKRAEAGQMQVCFPGDAAFPSGLLDIPDAPPVLFYRGEAAPPRRWVAVVGSRHPDPGFLPFARRFVAEVAAGGVGIVSGAAEGVDRAAHWGALDAGVPTWAFIGSALDQMDAGPKGLEPHLLAAGGAVFSEFPPGVRGNPQTFPRRNRLISGAAHAVLVLRAADGSGSLHTVEAARAQGRPVLALPGEATNPAAWACNNLIRENKARLCLEVKDVWEAAGVVPGPAAGPAADAAVPLSELSPEAQQAYGLLARTPRAFEDVLAESTLSSAALTIALTELELSGRVHQHPGKLYERV